MLTDEQIARIQALIDQGKKSKSAPETKVESASDAAAEAAKSPRTSSSMFGASSGVSAASVESRAETKARSDAAVAAALKDATPQEILAAWKQAQLRGGGDPNQAFIEAFSPEARKIAR